jgi:hypothetical protein
MFPATKPRCVKLEHSGKKVHRPGFLASIKVKVAWNSSLEETCTMNSLRSLDQSSLQLIKRLKNASLAVLDLVIFRGIRSGSDDGVGTCLVQKLRSFICISKERCSDFRASWVYKWNKKVQMHKCPNTTNNVRSLDQGNSSAAIHKPTYTVSWNTAAVDSTYNEGTWTRYLLPVSRWTQPIWTPLVWTQAMM